MIFWELFLVFFEIGLFSVGGGLSMLRLIEDAVVSHGWMELSELVDFVAIAESTPGPIAVNVATFAGNRVAGFFGGLCATLGVVAPSFIVILVVARFYARFRKSKVVSGVMNGLKPAVVGLIAAALLSVALAVFFPEGVSLLAVPTPRFLVTLGIFAGALALTFKKLHPAWIICLSAAVGVAAGYAFF